MAIILDVSHADQPGADSLDVCAIDKIAGLPRGQYTPKDSGYAVRRCKRA